MINETIFRNAESTFVPKHSDQTGTGVPKFPTGLKALSTVFEADKILGSIDNIAGIPKFVERLSEMPLAERSFALPVALRMPRQREISLPVQDVISAFGMNQFDLKKTMKILEHHGLAGIDDK